MTSSIDGRRQTGQLGEQLACRLLEESGYAILERNWRCRTGELDIVAEQEGVLIFIEVRTRKSVNRFGTPAESVERRKQSRIRQIARVYMTMNSFHEKPVRFDVITVMLERDNSLQRIEHYENAF